jgi:hypothetical protein
VGHVAAEWGLAALVLTGVSMPLSAAGSATPPASVVNLTWGPVSLSVPSSGNYSSSVNNWTVLPALASCPANVAWSIVVSSIAPNASCVARTLGVRGAVWLTTASVVTTDSAPGEQVMVRTLSNGAGSLVGWGSTGVRIVRTARDSGVRALLHTLAHPSVSPPAQPSWATHRAFGLTWSEPSGWPVTTSATSPATFAPGDCGSPYFPRPRLFLGHFTAVFSCTVMGYGMTLFHEAESGIGFWIASGPSSTFTSVTSSVVFREGSLTLALQKPDLTTPSGALWFTVSRGRQVWTGLVGTGHGAVVATRILRSLRPAP